MDHAEQLQKVCQEAWQAYREAEQIYREAGRAYRRAYQEAEKAERACQEEYARILKNRAYCAAYRVPGG